MRLALLILASIIFASCETMRAADCEFGKILAKRVAACEANAACRLTPGYLASRDWYLGKCRDL